MIPVHPKIAQRNGAPRTGLRVQKHLCDFGQPFRKIGQQLSCDLAFISARSVDPRHRHIFLLCRGTHPADAYSSRISSVNRLCCFIPEAPSSVRMALAVRPCRPITLPKSSGCTRSSTTVACGPSTVATFTSSGWSTSALAICSTSSFMPAPPYLPGGSFALTPLVRDQTEQFLTRRTPRACRGVAEVGQKSDAWLFRTTRFSAAG